MPAKENPNQIRLDEAVINIGSGMSLVKDRDDLQPKNRYTLDSANSDFVQYTGNNTIPTGAPPAGVDTRVLLNGNRYDWNGTAWVLQPNAIYDATVSFSVNTNPNTGGTIFTPNTPGLTTVIYVSSIDGSQWTYNGSSYVTAPVSPDWKITGNAGTVQATNFIGTTDNIGLSFRTNNVIRQTITNSGEVGIDIAVPTAKFDVRNSSMSSTAYFKNNNGSGGFAVKGESVNTGVATGVYGELGVWDGTRWSGVRGNSGVAAAPAITGINTVAGGVSGYFNERVAIGLTSPTSTFHVNGSEAGAILNITATTVLNATHRKILVSNAAVNITITLPDALTCIGREYKFSRAAGSTGSITLQRSSTNVIQALNGTTGITSSIGAHSAGGAGLNHTFTAINIGGIGVWVRI